MRVNRVVGVAAMVACAVAWGAGGAATAPAGAARVGEAEKTAEAYCGMIHAGKGTAAVEKYWDFDVMFDSIFGEKMKEVSAADRGEMRKTMLKIIGQAYANPQVNAALQKATFTGFAGKEREDHRVAVDFQIELGPGKAIPNTLTLAEEKGEWRVVDAATNGVPLSDALRGQYEKTGMTPVAYVREMGRETGG